MEPASAPGPGGWPLSAPATAVLRDPGTAPQVLLRLALRELVVRGAVRVHRVERARHGPGTVRLAPGDVDASSLPVPLRLLATALLPHLTAEGTPARTAVRRAAGWRADLSPRVREAARHELDAAGLLRQEHDRLLGVLPRTRWQLTPTGRAWARSASDAAVSGAGLLPATGLLLALDQDLQRRLREAAGEADGSVPVGWGGDDVEALDAVLGDAGPALDSAVDAGSGGGGGDGGGDGGGGD